MFPASIHSFIFSRIASIRIALSDVKYFLSQGKVLVNGEVATERGKKIRHGDIVELKGVGSVEVELEA